MHVIDITVTSDFICPWCWIGLKHLNIAIENTKTNNAVRMRYAPYELNPDFPKEGVDRREYRIRKFGSWARSQAMDNDVMLAGQQAGLEFRYDRVMRTPNTRLAHQLIYSAHKNMGDTANIRALYEHIFSAYFNEGQDIGNADILAELAMSDGFSLPDIKQYLLSTDEKQEIISMELNARRTGIVAVPFFEIGGYTLSGAQPVSVFSKILYKAAEK
ncbi:MAG: DsbA family oxidoreductase [Pseudomonadota bacterium]